MPSNQAVLTFACSVVEDPLPAAKAAAGEVLAARMDKAVHIVSEEVNNRCWSSVVNEQGEVLRKGTPSNLMDWNSTARSFQMSFLACIICFISLRIVHI
jgi:hypothetical protein